MSALIFVYPDNIQSFDVLSTSQISKLLLQMQIRPSKWELGP